MTARVLATAVHAVPTLLWGIIAFEFWRMRWRHRPRSTLYLLLPLATTLFAMHMLLHLVAEILPTGGSALSLEPHGAVGLVTTGVMVSIAPIVRHIILLLPMREVAVSRRWLWVNYGSAVVVGLGYVALLSGAGTGGHDSIAADVIANAYVLSALGAATLSARRSASRGSWLQGVGVTELRSADMVVFALALGGTGTMLLALWTTGSTTLSGALVLLLHTVVAIAFAVPFAVRMLGRVVRSFVLSALVIGASGILFFGVPALTGAMGERPEARLIDLAAFAALLLALVPGLRWLQRAVDRLLFRRSVERHADLQRVAAALSPSDGLEVCIRRSLAELTRIMQFAGSAIVLTRRRGAFAHGEIDLEALEGAWATDRPSTEVLSRPLMELELRDLPPDLQSPLVAAHVVRLAPIGSPRQRWGYLFATEPLLAPPISEADLDALAAFLNQLALVLDGCELLERAIGVERSLAHAEKLAAIGELAARVAHEIRNPITAAHSLAQLLARDPTAPANAEHADIILTELERVERQIATLLRFARREEFEFVTADLRDVVRRAVGDLSPALDKAGIEMRLDLDGPVIARIDVEKLRQVLINLVENARDAVTGSDGDRHIDVALRSADGKAHLRVADNGPGIPADAVASVFEPFFSRKPQGTGLGLAIVKRTIEAHAGHVVASTAPEGGAAFDIDLPLEQDA